MKKIQVEVCVCTACVMNGSVDIMDSVESLRDLRQQMNDGLEPVQPRAGRYGLCTGRISVRWR